MTYSTTRCPHCKSLIDNQKNPIHEIASPFEKCRFCGHFYINSYKEEWITKSPLKRALFLFGNGTLIRALLLPLVVCALILGLIFGAILEMDVHPIFIVIFGIIGIPIWLIIECNLKKDALNSTIKASISRTNNPEYIKLLKKAGYKIYPLSEQDSSDSVLQTVLKEQE